MNAGEKQAAAGCLGTILAPVGGFLLWYDHGEAKTKAARFNYAERVCDEAYNAKPIDKRRDGQGVRRPRPRGCFGPFVILPAWKHRRSDTINPDTHERCRDAIWESGAGHAGGPGASHTVSSATGRIQGKAGCLKRFFNLDATAAEPVLNPAEKSPAPAPPPKPPVVQYTLYSL